MEPSVLGEKYDKIAKWWHGKHYDSQYGIKQIEGALKFCSHTGAALDVGCGAGGRIVRMLQDKGFSITGIDVSPEMIRLAFENHPSETFLVQDICAWETSNKYNFIVAWDSIFHLPLSMQKPTIAKLCNYLSVGGVLIYTFGDTVGEHTDDWRGDTFYYSSIGIKENLRVLSDNGVTCRHLELDQWPQKHVYIIGTKS